MSALLTDRVALITGGGTGIGRAIAEAYVREGARVVVTGRRAAPLDALAEAHPERVVAAPADVTLPSDRARAVQTAVDRFGGLDILVNNAALHFAAPLAETTDDQIRSLFDVNVLSLLSLTRDALPALVARNGTVINVSSVVGRGPMPAYSTYAPSKAAVDHITRCLAVELGPQGIRVNAIAPGATETDMSAEIRQNEAFLNQLISMTPLGRLGQPDDIAPTAVFLASDQASWVTGQILQAGGGLLA